MVNPIHYLHYRNGQCYYYELLQSRFYSAIPSWQPLICNFHYDAVYSDSAWGVDGRRECNLLMPGPACLSLLHSNGMNTFDSKVPYSTRFSAGANWLYSHPRSDIDLHHLRIWLMNKYKNLQKPFLCLLI